MGNQSKINSNEILHKYDKWALWQELKWVPFKDKLLKEGITEIDIKQVKQEYSLNEIEAIWDELQDQKIGKDELSNLRGHGYT